MAIAGLWRDGEGAFDLLHLNGHDLRGMALEDRREILAGMLVDLGGRIQFSEPLPGEAKATITITIRCC